MVFCGQCNREYASDSTYLNHVCTKTGVKPTDTESMGDNWYNIQSKALERGRSVSGEAKYLAAMEIVEARKKSK